MDERLSERYLRHFALDEVGAEGQEKLNAAKVLVIGAGGLGSAAILYLAAAGVGTIGICDDDRVELKNLQRQIIHTTASVGTLKAESAKRAVRELDPHITVVTHCIRASADNISDLIAPYDFVLDCTDRFESKFLINDACVFGKKPFCHAGVVRFGGQAMTYVPGRGPCLRCLLGPVPHGAPTCAEIGVLGASVGVMGCVQATEAVKYILGRGRLLTGRVLRYDGLEMTMNTVEFPHPDSECAVCSDKAIIRSLSDARADYDTAHTRRDHE